MVGRHRARGHVHRGPQDRCGGDGHQLSGPTGGPGNPDDTIYRTFLQAFNLKDLVDLHPVLQETYYCCQGTVRSRTSTVSCQREATFTIASYHY